MNRRHEATRWFCAAWMVLAAASTGWAQTAKEEAKKEPAAKTEPAKSATANGEAICKPSKSTEEFNTLEDLFAAGGMLSFEEWIGPQAPERLDVPNPAETPVLWRVVQPD